jgi:hypothetical protein
MEMNKIRTVTEIGAIYEVRCPCGRDFVVDCVGSVLDEAITSLDMPDSAEKIDYTMVYCPRCRKNSFVFAYKHTAIRSRHPLFDKVWKSAQDAIKDINRWNV